ncbi:hypothetical protein KY289_001882 [Solanum tuberosum]|nr:hypothetical protein KY289_001882 [Solanum tuberosum]
MFIYRTTSYPSPSGHQRLNTLRGYHSSTYKPAICKSKQCYFAKVESYSCTGDYYCLSKPAQPRPGCNNNTCHSFVVNPVINTYTYSAELAEDVLVIGVQPIILVSKPRFIVICVKTYIMERLAKGVTDSRFSRKFGICLSSSTRSSGVIFVGSTPYYVYYPKIDISKNLVYTPQVTKPRDWMNPSEYHVKVSSSRKRRAT